MKDELRDTFAFSDQEKKLFKELSIGALVLFGSHAQNAAGPLSDFDFGLIIDDKSILNFSEKRTKIYNEVYDILSSRIKKLVNIDIVFLERAPYELRAHVMKHGEIVFEARPGVFADFKAMVMEQYSDFAPIKKIFHEGILSRI